MPEKETVLSAKEEKALGSREREGLGSRERELLRRFFVIQEMEGFGSQEKGGFVGQRRLGQPRPCSGALCSRCLETRS